MKNVCGMKGFEGAESLVDKVLAVVIRKYLSSDDSVHVSFHELLDQVDFVELFVGDWFLDVNDGNDLEKG